jgi:hypothetical protein
MVSVSYRRISVQMKVRSNVAAGSQFIIAISAITRELMSRAAVTSGGKKEWFMVPTGLGR